MKEFLLSAVVSAVLILNLDTSLAVNSNAGKQKPAELDRIIRVTMKYFEALKKNGGNPKFTVYPEVGHDSWTQAYNTPELYEWLLQQKRATNAKGR